MPNRVINNWHVNRQWKIICIHTKKNEKQSLLLLGKERVNCMIFVD